MQHDAFRQPVPSLFSCPNVHIVFLFVFVTARSLVAFTYPNPLYYFSLITVPSDLPDQESHDSCAVDVLPSWLDYGTDRPSCDPENFVNSEVQKRLSEFDFAAL